MIDMKGCTVVKAAGPCDLEKLTSEGWILLAVLSEGVIETSYDQEPVHVLPPNMQPNNYGYQTTGLNGTVETRRGHAVQRSLFLLGRDDSSALAQAKARGDEFEAKYKEWDKKLEAERKNVAGIGQAFETERDARKRLEETHTIVCKNYNEGRERNVRLEGDIAKIRTAIGEREMQRILAEPHKGTDK